MKIRSEFSVVPLTDEEELNIFESIYAPTIALILEYVGEVKKGISKFYALIKVERGKVAVDYFPCGSMQEKAPIQEERSILNQLEGNIERLILGESIPNFPFKIVPKD